MTTASDTAFVEGLVDGIVQDIVLELWPWWLGLFVVLTLLGLGSLLPARRGHWSTLFLVLLPVVCGIYGVVCLGMAPFHEPGWPVMGVLILTFVVPLGVAGGSLRLWFLRRPSRRRQREAA
jgi:hypothetical protein